MAKWRDVKQSRIKETLKSTTVLNQVGQMASIGSRLKAFLTDSFLITTPLFYIVIYFFMGGGVGFSENKLEGWSIILVSNYLIIAILWLGKGQTPGLTAYNLKLVNQEKQKISFFQSILRYLGTLISFISVFLLFLPFFNKQKKTFQDLVSNTMIINED